MTASGSVASVACVCDCTDEASSRTSKTAVEGHTQSSTGKAACLLAADACNNKA
jgi:hypothetical protein